MSANNYIQITKLTNTELPLYQVEHKDMDTGERIDQDPIGIFADLEEAVKVAQKFIEEAEFGVEYGIWFKL